MWNLHKNDRIKLKISENVSLPITVVSVKDL